MVGDYALGVIVYALVSGLAPEEAVDVFLRRDDAAAALAAALHDEPEWRDILSVVPIELNEFESSPN